MILRLVFALMLLLGGTSVAGANPDERFSQTLNAAERTASGLGKLTSDQVAVIDALVRRDTGKRAVASGTPRTTDLADAAPSTFSRRLNADERRAAGLAGLGAAEVAQLDAFVDRHQAGRLARSTFLAPLATISRSASRITPTETKPERKIHGTFSLSYGWGSGGYSERTGAMVVNYDDPEGRYSVSIGYSETHVKGPQIYRDPYYDAPRAPLRESPDNK